MPNSLSPNRWQLADWPSDWLSDVMPPDGPPPDGMAADGIQADGMAADRIQARVSQINKFYKFDNLQAEKVVK